ncbi:MAG: hypothetical protein PHO72_10965 [Sphaerochaeta sp.]|jgi:excisionase family DNA binding protein|nr:hypothetical protein [Sphaerochaeta sp.]MDD3058829.1 hypothetical protein [Sphaerochaeta sp.]
MASAPRMMTIREIARTGLLSDHALRRLLKAGQLPAVYIGKKALINYDKLVAQLDSLESDVPRRLDASQLFN